MTLHGRSPAAEKRRSAGSGGPLPAGTRPTSPSGPDSGSGEASTPSPAPGACGLSSRALLSPARDRRRPREEGQAGGSLSPRQALDSLVIRLPHVCPEPDSPALPGLGSRGLLDQPPQVMSRVREARGRGTQPQSRFSAPAWSGGCLEWIPLRSGFRSRDTRLRPPSSP